MNCVRSITFVIPGMDGAPDVQVTAVENGGALDFTVEILPSDEGHVGDLRGLFFNVNDDLKLAGLDAAGDDVADHQTGEVIDLGQGANMRGAAEPFDAGIEFGGPGIGKNKGDVQLTSFTLSNDAGNLTLDDIAQVAFGARVTSIGENGGDRNGSAKLVALAPAAPDAQDDSYSIFEDGADGLDDPSDTAAGVLFEVLDNDTDADGDTLTITHVYGAMHGTVEIVDGDDADTEIGDAILYTPDTDYAGPDSFTYCITDNNGGTDFATVSVGVAAVADVPDISIAAFATPNINEVLLVVSSETTDDDGSEFIDILSSSPLPAGVTLAPAGPVGPGALGAPLVQQYLLTLPADADSDFDLTFTAVAEETSNGDTETNSATISIETDFETAGDSLAFVATDQSIWESGPAFEFSTGTQFLGVDTGYNSGGWGGSVLGGSWEYDLRVGFEQTLEFEGGSIDATIPYDISVDYFYNKTTDILSLDPLFGLAGGGGFLTDGPSLEYALDFVFDILVGGQISVAGKSLGETFDESDSESIIDYDSETDGPLDLGDEDNSFSGTIDWPELNVADDTQVGDIYSGSGDSNDALTFNVDADQLIADVFFGGVNLFDFGIDLFSDTVKTGAEINLELLDLDLFAGARFAQEFILDGGDVGAKIVFEDDSMFDFDLSSPTQYANASAFDVNDDDIIEFDLLFEMENTMLGNDTDLVLSVGADLDLLEYSWKAGFAGAVKSGGGTIFDLSPATADVASINVYDNEFELAVAGDAFSFFG